VAKRDKLLSPAMKRERDRLLGHCMECHSPRERGVSDYSRTGLGGRRVCSADVQGFPASWSGATAANITSHPDKGLGEWSDEEIKRAITPLD
jgi:hypothetical protein